MQLGTDVKPRKISGFEKYILPRRIAVSFGLQLASVAYLSLVLICLYMTKVEQVETRRVTIESIMRTHAFRHGVNDVRKGRRPRFGDWGGAVGTDWEYERGRLFGILAPHSLEIVIEGKLNPKAIDFYRWREKDII